MMNSFVLGTVLGDAYIDRYRRLCIEHSSKQKAYVDWKYEQLRQMGVLPLTSVIKVKLQLHKQNLSTYETLYFRTKAVFLREREYFYEVCYMESK